MGPFIIFFELEDLFIKPIHQILFFLSRIIILFWPTSWNMAISIVSITSLKNQEFRVSLFIRIEFSHLNSSYSWQVSALIKFIWQIKSLIIWNWSFHVLHKILSFWYQVKICVLLWEIKRSFMEVIVVTLTHHFL